MRDKKIGFDLSDPTFNYLGHFREERFIRQGHNDSGKAPLPLDPDEAKKFGEALMQSGLERLTQSQDKKEPKEKKRVRTVYKDTADY
jgi:hypothetical protein